MTRIDSSQLDPSGATSGQIMTSNGSKMVVTAAPSTFLGSFPFSNYEESEDVGPFNTTSTSLVQAFRHTTASLPAGDYHIEWEFYLDQFPNGSFDGRIQLDDTTELGAYRTVIDIDDKLPCSGFKKVTLTSGSHTIDLDVSTPSGTLSVHDMRITIWKVPS